MLRYLFRYFIHYYIFELFTDVFTLIDFSDATIGLPELYVITSSITPLMR